LIFIDGAKIDCEIASTCIGYGTYTGNQKFENINGNFSPRPSYDNALSIEEVKPGNLHLGLTRDEAKELAYKALTDLSVKNMSDDKLGIETMQSGLLAILDFYWKPEKDSSLPLTFLTGAKVPTLGSVLVQDQIPPIDKAVFAQVKYQFGDDTQSTAYANGDHNDTASFDQLANVIGLGATWRIGDNVRLSYDWGQNRTDFGRFMNGNTIYKHETGTSDFDIAGRSNGGTPRFWVARVDIGKADTDKPGSWNAFADYKYFQHSAFFGGNGTEGVTDRYMDGIKSFTIGGGYVPAKDFLLEAFYTFGAKGIGKRDTLYGPEHFTLGDYTRVQVSYKF
jgi:hypothetical protein